MRKRLIRSFTQAMLGMLAFFARLPRLVRVSDFLTRSLARLAARTKGIGHAG